MSGVEILAPLLVLLGIVLLVLAGIDVTHPRIQLGWLGLASWAGAEFVLLVT